MFKKNLFKVVVASSLMGVCGFLSAETFNYDTFHPKYETSLTIEKASEYEVQVMPTMVEHEKLGDFYYYDKMYKNLHKAYQYYRLGAKQGSNYAQYMIGKMNLNGDGVEKDILKARDMLELVGAPYDRFAARLLAESYYETENYNEATKYLKKANTPEAYYQLGKRSVKEDRGEGFNWLREAAEEGHVKSNALLGKLLLERVNKRDASFMSKRDVYKEKYESEFGLTDYEITKKRSEKRIREAIAHLRHAAENGVEESQYLLGQLYFNGNSYLKANHQKGFSWLLIAGQNGNEDALRKAYWILAEQEKEQKYDLESDPELKNRLYKILNSY